MPMGCKKQKAEASSIHGSPYFSLVDVTFDFGESRIVAKALTTDFPAIMENPFGIAKHAPKSGDLLGTQSGMFFTIGAHRSDSDLQSPGGLL